MWPFRKKQFLIEIFWNTDPEGIWVEYDDWSNFCWYGPFKSYEAAAYHVETAPDDKDMKDYEIRKLKRKERKWLNDPYETLWKPWVPIDETDPNWREKFA